MKNKSIYNNIYYEYNMKNILNNKEDRLKNQGEKLKYQKEYYEDNNSKSKHQNKCYEGKVEYQKEYYQKNKKIRDYKKIL